MEPLPGEMEVEHPGTTAPTLVDLFEMTEAEWRAWSRGSPLRRAGYHGFRRSVAVAMGNWASPDAVPALVGALSDPEPIVRGHAAWALGQAGSSEAVSALKARGEVESDSYVLAEVESALSSGNGTNLGSMGVSGR